CLACDEHVITAGHLRGHLLARTKRPRSVGKLDLNFRVGKRATQSGLAEAPTALPVADASTYDNGLQHSDFLTSAENTRLQQLFARAIHTTAMPYQAFNHPAWRAFFQSLRLDVACYRLILNLMACGPVSFFSEHFTLELRRESAAKLLEKLVDGKKRLQSAPIFWFCSDSQSVMVKLRNECLLYKAFVFAYGCAPHAIHNLCMDLAKHFTGIKPTLKKLVAMVKEVRSSHRLQQLFENLCGDSLLCAKRVLEVKAACTAIPGAIVASEFDIDCCSTLSSLLTDLQYWQAIEAMEALFRPICSCLTYLEGEEATISAVYACFVATANGSCKSAGWGSTHRKRHGSLL
ncbi:TPA: hypothetical protein N0F65_004840, partial [Lagenidium giganteum]